MRLTPMREKIIRHCLEYVFLYHLTDDRNKFPMQEIRSLHRGGILDKNFAGVDHDDNCYELSELGYAWAVYHNLVKK